MAQKENYHKIRYGTRDGEIKFGHLTADNQIDAVLIRNFRNYKHYISMCMTGEDHRKNGTICRSTGQFAVRAADAVGKDIPGIYLESISGDVVIKAPSGKVRIEAIDIEMVANGSTNETGNINMKANEKIILDAGQVVDIKAKVSTKIFSEKTVEVIGKAVLNMYGGMIDCADSAATAKTSKGSLGGSDNEERMRGIAGGLTV